MKNERKKKSKITPDTPKNENVSAQNDNDGKVSLP